MDKESNMQGDPPQKAEAEGNLPRATFAEGSLDS